MQRRNSGDGIQSYKTARVKTQLSTFHISIDCALKPPSDFFFLITCSSSTAFATSSSEEEEEEEESFLFLAPPLASVAVAAAAVVPLAKVPSCLRGNVTK